MEKIRMPAVAGMFYPGAPDTLKKEINYLLSNYKPSKTYGNVLGIVSPHAGYKYSGATAAYAYNTIAGKSFETVVIISPSHREYFPGVSIYSGDAYRTPLGIISVNKQIRKKLIEESPAIFAGEEGHREEHALEVQLPFLQIVLGNFDIVPVVMGDQRKKFVDDLALALSKVLDKNILIVASSDLSHFYPKQKASELDQKIEEYINNYDYTGLVEDLEKRNCEACGGGPIAVMMRAIEMNNKPKSEVLSRTDSGDVTGDNSEVVGYLSAVVYA